MSIQPPRDQAPAPTRNHYQCRDGHWIILSIMPTEDRWKRFSKLVGDGVLASDPRYADAALRDANAYAMTADLDAIFARKDYAEWKALLEANGLIFGIVARIEDVANDQQAIATGALVAFEGESLMTVSSPFWLAGQQKVTPRRAPSVGQHNEAVLAGLGYTGADIASLRAAGVIG